MSKVWYVKVDQMDYEIKLKGNKIFVNNEGTKLKSLLIKREWFQSTFAIKVGAKEALLIASSLLGGTKLVIDEKDCATGEAYVPVKIPKWAYIFMALHMINLFLGGLLGAVIGLIGCSATISISSNKKIPIAGRVALDFLVLIIIYVLVLGIGIGISLAQA